MRPGAFSDPRATTRARLATTTRRSATPPRAIASISRFSARQVRLVSDPGDGGGDAGGEKRSHEIISTIVAIRRAKQAGLDLVEVNPRADPPVCRLMNYDAFRYELRQKERDARKRAVERRRHDQVKELRLSARISANDLKTKAVQTERFLEQGHKVTLRVAFNPTTASRKNCDRRRAPSYTTSSARSWDRTAWKSRER